MNADELIELALKVIEQSITVGPESVALAAARNQFRENARAYLAARVQLQAPAQAPAPEPEPVPEPTPQPETTPEPQAEPEPKMVRKVFTTGQAAKICKVAPRTICKWFDSGRLRGYRIPGSQDRRIPRDQLIRFLRDNGMPEAETLVAEEE